ncbi:prephenate dehydrogenase [Catalinimonas alkaloidigena]|uniref:Prephenate dehydrogenase n=1 Tax=Catalinimonas alkaloidigena TaxID=1075417 RepID=A0A1G9JGE4_9BACT|nr:prephenate dehydrogenase/arogenate dehydrogenase family protein [Catalinimonas alkaloidigena]SDL36650.1 prephenate dehydrogenase [Catalinimonas alkaloidigena]
MDKVRLTYGVIGGGQGLGGWFARFLRKKELPVLVSDISGKGDFTDNRELARHANVVILAVPIKAMIPVLEEIYPELHGKVLIDVCSVKEFLVERVEQLREENPDQHTYYASIHPMFAPTMEQLRGQGLLWNYETVLPARFERFFRGLFSKDGARWYDVDYRMHDRLMGVVQGLNHFNVFVSAKALRKCGVALADIKNFASPPYRIFIVFFTRYVLQNPALYADIQMYNRHVAPVLRLFREEVDRLLTIIENQDRPAFTEYVNEMQPYFEPNQDDSALSSHLIHQLGVYLDRARKAESQQATAEVEGTKKS